jgi:hypothetical protein
MHQITWLSGCEIVVDIAFCINPYVVVQRRNACRQDGRKRGSRIFLYRRGRETNTKRKQALECKDEEILGVRRKCEIPTSFRVFRNRYYIVNDIQIPDARNIFIVFYHAFIILKNCS